MRRLPGPIFILLYLTKTPVIRRLLALVLAPLARISSDACPYWIATLAKSWRCEVEPENSFILARGAKTSAKSAKTINEIATPRIVQ
jgi:hypothetical protein